MDLSNILVISGRPGLYRLVSQTKTGAVIESLCDGKRVPAFKNDKISSLSEICMFTMEEDYPLSNVFKNIYIKENKNSISFDFKKSSTKDLFHYFGEVLPNMDMTRIYPSDIKKALSWYNLLLSKDLIDDEVDNTSENPQVEQMESEKE